MEDTNMKKKENYLKPALEVYEMELESNLLVASVYTTGLDNDELVIPDDDEKSGDTWDDAW